MVHRHEMTGQRAPLLPAALRDTALHGLCRRGGGGLRVQPVRAGSDRHSTLPIFFVFGFLFWSIFFSIFVWFKILCFLFLMACKCVLDLVLGLNQSESYFARNPGSWHLRT